MAAIRLHPVQRNHLCIGTNQMEVYLSNIHYLITNIDKAPTLCYSDIYSRLEHKRFFCLFSQISKGFSI
jgi:hypothetical protein